MKDSFENFIQKQLQAEIKNIEAEIQASEQIKNQKASPELKEKLIKKMYELKKKDG